jgi:hypothetical protein
MFSPWDPSFHVDRPAFETLYGDIDGCYHPTSSLQGDWRAPPALAVPYYPGPALARCRECQAEQQDGRSCEWKPGDNVQGAGI